MFCVSPFANLANKIPANFGFCSIARVVTVLSLPMVLISGARADLLTLNLPGITIAVPGVPASLAALGNQAAPLLLTQVNTINATAARITGLNAGNLVDQGLGQLLNGVGAQGQQATGAPPLGAAAPAPGANLGVYGAASYTYSEHKGYAANFAGQSSTSAGLREQGVSVIPAFQFDVSQAFGAAPGKVKFALFSGGGQSEVDVKADSLLQQAGFARAGFSRRDYLTAGGYGLALWGNSYAAVLAAGDWGRVESRNDILGSQSTYGTQGRIAALTLGHVLSVTSAWRLDLRSQLAYERQSAHDHTDSGGLKYSNINAESVTGNLSARAFTVISAGNLVYRPFLQIGVSQRFRDINDATIGATKFSYSDGNTTEFGRVGLDVEIGKNIQTYVSVRGDTSHDQRSVTGQAGLLFKFN